MVAVAGDALAAIRLRARDRSWRRAALFSTPPGMVSPSTDSVVFEGWSHWPWMGSMSTACDSCGCQIGARKGSGGRVASAARGDRFLEGDQGMMTQIALGSFVHRGFSLLVLIAILGRSGFAAVPQTVRPDWTIVDWHVSHDTLRVVAEILGLSDSQWEYAASRWERYYESVIQIDVEGAQEWQLLRERSVAEPEFAGELYSDAVSHLVRSSLRRSDLALESFLSELGAVISDDQVKLLPRAREAIEWESFFEEDLGPSVVDLGGRHDVRELYQSAVAKGILPSEQQVRDAGALEVIRASEEAYVSGVLQQIRWVRQHMRTARGERRTNFGSAGNPRRWWQRIQRLALAHVEAIAAVAENVTGLDAAWEWRSLFARSVAPRLSRDFLLSSDDSLEAWLTELDSVELRDALLADAQAWRDLDRVRIWELVERGIGLINREGTLVGSSRSQIEFIAKVLERCAEHEIALRRIASALESAGVEIAMREYRKGAPSRLGQIRSTVPLAMRDVVFAIEGAPSVLVELQEEFGSEVEGILMSPSRRE